MPPIWGIPVQMYDATNFSFLHNETQSCLSGVDVGPWYIAREVDEPFLFFHKIYSWVRLTLMEINQFYSDDVWGNILLYAHVDIIWSMFIVMSKLPNILPVDVEIF